jgi:asparagine synthase (glutamine-hydrolysing)
VKELDFPMMGLVIDEEEFLRPEWREKIKTKEFKQKLYKEIIDEFPKLEGEDPENANMRRIHWIDMNFMLQYMLERKVWILFEYFTDRFVKDRMSMRSGLEVRVPFADHELVEYVWNIPSKFKTVNGVEKTILRESVEKGLLPEEIRTRKKVLIDYLP